MSTEVPETADVDLDQELTNAFAAETPSQDAEKPAAAPEKASSEPEAALEVPHHWTEADKSLWKNIPRDVQGRWIAREKEYQKGIDSKAQEAAGYRRERERLDELLSPFQRDLELRGVDRLQFIQSLVGGHKYLTEKPREAALWLLNQYGVDPKTLLEEQQAAPHSAEISQLRSELQGFFGKQREQEQQRYVAQVESFAAEKDEKGQLLRPYFDELTEEIKIVLGTQPAGQKDLNAAYQKAMRLNDGVWQREQTRLALEKTQAEDAKRKAEIDKAKRAAVGSDSRGQPGAAKPTELRDELEQAFSSAGWH